MHHAKMPAGHLVYEYVPANLLQKFLGNLEFSENQPNPKDLNYSMGYLSILASENCSDQWDLIEG